LKKVILVQELRNLLSENNWNFSLQLYWQKSVRFDFNNQVIFGLTVRNLLLLMELNYSIFFLIILEKIISNKFYYTILAWNFNYFLNVNYLDKQLDLMTHEQLLLS
jgi:hypothetical protein